jgi:hypothetical protein
MNLFDRLIRIVPDWQPTVVVSVTILYLTLFPQPLGDDEIELFEGADKVVHAIMFGTLTAAMIFDRWHEGRPLTRKGALWCAAVAIAAGGLIELLQGAMGMGRGCDTADFAADAAGALIGALLCRGWTKRGLRRSKG